MKDELGEVFSPEAFVEKFKTSDDTEVYSIEEFVKQAVPTEEVYSPTNFAKQFSTPKEEVYTPEAFAKSITPTKEGSFLSEGIKAVPGGLAASVEMYGRIGRTLGIPGADELVKIGKDLGVPFGPTSEKFIPSVVRSGIESKIQSFAAAIPGAIVGSLGGVGGAIAGAALSGGTLFALTEWDQYLEDVENNAYANGATPEEAKVIRDSMKGRALVSALAEGVPEAIADYIELRLLGLTAGTTLRLNLKKAIVQSTIRYFGKILPVELGTELPTTAVQTYEREQAGIPTGPMGKNLLHTAGSVVVSTLLGAKGGTMLRTALQNQTTPATFRGYQEDPVSGKKFGLYNLKKDMGEFKKGDTVTADWLKKNGVEVENDPADNVDEIVRTFEEAQKKVDDIPAFGSKEEALAYGATSVDENMVPLLKEEVAALGMTKPEELWPKLAVLSGALKRNAHYDTERGLVIDEPTDEMYERVIRAVEPKSSITKYAVLRTGPLKGEAGTHYWLDVGQDKGGLRSETLERKNVAEVTATDMGAPLADYKVENRNLSEFLYSLTPEYNITLIEDLIGAIQYKSAGYDAVLFKSTTEEVESVFVDLNKHSVSELKDYLERELKGTDKTVNDLESMGVFKDVSSLQGLTKKGSFVDQKIAFARSQVDQSAWLKFFAGEGDSPDVPNHNLGEDLSSSILSDEKVNKEETDQDIRTKNIDPQRINWLSRLLHPLHFPEYSLRNMKAAKNSAAIIEGEQYLHSVVSKYGLWYNKFLHGLKQEEREQIGTAMDLMYKIQSTEHPIASIAYAKKQLVDLYAQYPRVQKAIDGIDKRGGIITMFEYVKNRMQNSLRQSKLMKFSPEETIVFNDISKSTTEQTAIESVKRNFDIEGMTRKEIDKHLGEGTWIGMKDTKKQQQRDKIIKSEANRMLKETREVEDIKKWGLRDYITHIELGAYRVLDADGNTLGFGRTEKEAKSKAYEIRTAMKKKGIDVGILDVKASIGKVNPTAQRKDVLLGEKDITKVLPKYIYAMEKRIVMQPIIDQYDQDVKKNPQDYPANVRKIIGEQIKYVMGGKYSWGDAFVDQMMVRFGLGTGEYSKNIRRLNILVTNEKLGYRPSAVTMDLLGGYGNTWVKVGNYVFAHASKVLKSGTYITNDGDVVDLKNKMKDLESRGQFGTSLIVEESGKMRTKTPLWYPLGFFQAAEEHIRNHCFAANYIYQRDYLGKNDFEATEAALLNLRFQQGTYNLAALPQILRSPGGKMIGKFKSYMIRQLEFMSTLKGKEIPRMIGLQLMMAGPRGAIYLLRSLPVLGAFGLLNDWEKWLVKKKGLVADIATRGIGGVVGGDLSAPATFQLPSRPEDWGGPFIGDMVRLFKDVIIPAVSSIGEGPNVAYIEDDAINWVASLSPLLYYLKEFDQSVMVWDSAIKGDFDQATDNLLQNIQKPNVWIRDSQNNKAYQVGGLQDRLLLLAGIPPVAKTQYQVLKRVWRQNEQVWRENSTKWYNKVSKKLLRGEEVSQDLWQDAILYGINPSSLPDAIKFKEMTPQERETMRANLFRKAEALQHFGIE